MPENNKECLGCGEFIPEKWSKHFKCGWNVKEAEQELNDSKPPKGHELADGFGQQSSETSPDTTTADMEKALKETIGILKDVLDENSPIGFDATKVAITLFLERRRNKR